MELRISLFCNGLPAVSEIHMHPKLSVFCSSIALCGLSQISVYGLCQISFHFLTVCQPDNSRHLIKGLVKCFIQQYLCHINYSYSTTLDKSHFDYTVIFQSIHLPDRDHGRSEEPHL